MWKSLMLIKTLDKRMLKEDCVCVYFSKYSILKQECGETKRSE